MRPCSSHSLGAAHSCTPARSKWNTTIKAIIPLPEKGDERTYPNYDFPPGMYVLACYPETTSFYRAVIASGPHAITTGAGKARLSSLLTHGEG